MAKNPRSFLSLVAFLLFGTCWVTTIALVEAWIPTGTFTANNNCKTETHQRIAHGKAGSRRSLVVTRAKDDKSKSTGGYKFGDLTRSLGKKVTGDPNYQFGDISRKLDQRVKSDVTKLTGKETYKFGDLSKWAASSLEEKVANYTGKDNYQVGDISKEVVRRVWAGEYDLEDVVLMCRVLLQMGASFTPIARLLPVKVLLEMLNVGLAQDVGSKVMGGVAKSLDERFKSALTGDTNYQLGDKSKEQLTKALSKFTGNESYSFGDISQAVASRMSEMDKNDGSTTTKASQASTEAMSELMNNEALEKWDRKLHEETTKKEGM